MFAVNIKRKALRNLEKLDKKQKQRITTIILILKKDPIPFRTDICKLRGYENTYRIRNRRFENCLPSLMERKDNTYSLHRVERKSL